MTSSRSSLLRSPMAVAMTPERLMLALETLAGTGSDLDVVPLLARLRQETAREPERTADAWLDMLVGVGPGVGLRLHAAEPAAADLQVAVGPKAPWLTLLSRPGHGADWLCVLGGDGRRLKVRWLESGRELWADDAQLAAWGATESRWLYAEPALPLAALQAEGDVGPVRRLLSFVRLETADIGIITAYSLAIGLLSLVVPLTVQSLVNTVAFGALLQPLVVLTLVVLIALGAAAALRVVQVGVAEMLQRRFFVRVALDMASRLPRVQADGFGSHHGPEMVNRFFEVVTMQKGGAALLLDGLAIALGTAIGMVLLAFYHPLLLAFDVVLVLGIWFVLAGLGRDAVPTAVRESKAKYAVAAWLEEIARFPEAFKSAPAARYALAHADSLTRAYLDARGRHYRVFVRQLVGSLGLQVVASAVLLGLGGWLVIERQLTLGQLVAAELIVSKVVEGFTKLSKYLETGYDLVAAADKLGDLVDLPLERAVGEVPPETGPVAVTCRRLPVAPPPAVVDWHLDAGSVVGLLGPEDVCHRLVDWLSGQRRPEGGVVEIDGLDIREWDLGALRSRVLVLRDVAIVAGSVADNVALGYNDVEPARLRAALAAVDLLDDLQALEAGLQTRLQTGGAPLTTGQSVRLMVARALVARPSLVIFDGLLDRLDPGGALRLVEQVRQFAGGSTVLVASRHPALLARCDLIYEVTDGRLSRRQIPTPPDSDR